MKKIMFLFLLLISNIAFAFDTIRINDKILSVGDSVARMLEIAGTPNAQAQIFNQYGGEIGQSYTYYINGKTVTFYIKSGKVTRINEQY